jgi:hypothetical protein
MSENNFEHLVNSLKENVTQLLSMPGGLAHLGIPDMVRVSPTIWQGIQKQTSEVQSKFPSGLRVELDPDLTGEQWELGPKRPSEAQPSEGDAGGPAT